MDRPVAYTNDLQESGVAIGVSRPDEDVINAGLGISVLQVKQSGHLLAKQVGFGFIAPIDTYRIRAGTAA